MREEYAKKAIEKLDGAVSKLPNAPKSFTYVDLLQVTQQLYAQQNYDMVCTICESVCKYLDDEHDRR